MKESELFMLSGLNIHSLKEQLISGL